MEIEKTIFIFLNNLTGASFGLDFLFYFFAEIMPIVMLLPFLYLLISSVKKNGYLIGEIMLAGLFARYLLVEIGRYFFPRTRPFIFLEDVNLLLPYKESLSFPSGHTAFVFAISTAIYLKNKKIGKIFYLLSLLVGLSRIVTGVHWPLDIFTGALLGIAAGIIIGEGSEIVKKKIKW